MLCILTQINKYWKHERCFNVTVACVSFRCNYGGEIKRYFDTSLVSLDYRGKRFLSLAPVKLCSNFVKKKFISLLCGSGVDFCFSLRVLLSPF